MFEFKVAHQKLVRTDSFFAVEKSRNYLAAHFDFLSDEWKDNGTITAFFRGKGFNEPAIVGADGTCHIPNAAVQNDGRVYVHLRYIGGDGIEIPTNEVAIDLKRTGTDAESSLPEPEPDIYEKIVEIATEAKNIAASVREDADNGVFVGEKGDTGAQGPQGGKGDQGTPGKDGYTPVKGTDYFTEEEKAEFVKEAKEYTDTEVDSVRVFAEDHYGLAMMEIDNAKAEAMAHTDDALKEVGWVKYGSVKIDMPIWTIQPQIATLSADGTSIESLRDITADDLAEYVTTETDCYYMINVNVDGSTLPTGCFRLGSTVTRKAGYNTELATIFYLKDYNTGDFKFSSTVFTVGYSPTLLVDFVEVDGVKKFRRAGELPAFKNLPIKRIYKLIFNGYMCAATENMNMAICGYFGMSYSNTLKAYPSLEQIYSYVSTAVGSSATDNRKIGVVAAQMDITITQDKAVATCNSYIVRAKDKRGTGKASGTHCGGASIRVPKTSLDENDGYIGFDASTGSFSYLFLNGTEFELYYQDI